VLLITKILISLPS